MQVCTFKNFCKALHKFFRTSKTDLKIRSIYHRIRDRIEAHICVSFVSYLLFKELEKVLAENQTNISANQAIMQINKMYEVVFQYANGNNQKVLLKNNSTQEQLMNIINSKF